MRNSYRDRYDVVSATLFNGMQSRSRDRGHKLEINCYEFQLWCKEQDGFTDNCNTWFEEGSPAYGKAKPSCNRLDDTIGYEFSNMEMITWGEHLKYTSESRLVGDSNNGNTEKYVPVAVFKLGKLVQVFDTKADALRFVKPEITSAGIRSASTKLTNICRGVGNNKTLYGHTYKFITN